MWIHFNIINSSDKKIWKTSIWVIFWNLSYGIPWRIPKTFPIIWLSLNIFKHNSKTNYLIPEFNLLNSFLISISFLTNYLHLHNYFILFLPHQYIDMKRKINMCLFMSKLFVWIQIKLVGTRDLWTLWSPPKVPMTSTIALFSIFSTSPIGLKWNCC
jgi:hypothetical protein